MQLPSFVRISLFGSVASTLFLTTSCGKDEVTPVPDPQPSPVETGTIKLEFKHKVDTAALVFGKNYVNAKGDTFKVSKFNYYISNIRLVKSDNSVYSETNSYHMVKHSQAASTIISLTNIPPGAYTSVSFMLGVDSARNVSGAQSGDLDPAVASDMYWSWNSGYIFLKMEGTSPKSGEVSKNLEYHIGGYKAPANCIRTISLPITTGLKKGESKTLQLFVNVMEILQGPSTVDFSQLPSVTDSRYAEVIANNYLDMFSLGE